MSINANRIVVEQYVSDISLRHDTNSTSRIQRAILYSFMQRLSETIPIDMEITKPEHPWDEPKLRFYLELYVLNEEQLQELINKEIREAFVRVGRKYE